MTTSATKLATAQPATAAGAAAAVGAAAAPATAPDSSRRTVPGSSGPGAGYFPGPPVDPSVIDRLNDLLRQRAQEQPHTPNGTPPKPETTPPVDRAPEGKPAPSTPMPAAPAPAAPAPTGRTQTSAPLVNQKGDGTKEVPVSIGPDVPADAPIPVIEQVSWKHDGVSWDSWGSSTSQVAVRDQEGALVLSNEDYDSRNGLDFSDPETENTLVADGWKITYEVQFYGEGDSPSQVVVTGAEKV